MFEKYILKNLKSEEKLVKIVRRYGLTLWWAYTVSILLIILAFFLLYPLIKLGSWGYLIFFVLIIFGVFFAARTFYVWSFDVFLITNKRVVDFNQKGLFYKNVCETTFDNIQDVSYNKKGLFPTLFNYGNIEVKTGSESGGLKFAKVHYPAKIQDKLIDCQSKFNRKK